MTKGRKTTTIGLRLPDDFIAKIEPRAQAKGVTVTAYIRDFIVREMMRPHHHRKGKGK